MNLKTTRYFREQILIKRPYIKIEWIQGILERPLKKEKQEDNRMRFWGRVSDFDDKVFRVVTLEDGETVHNAFPDRSFKEKE
jgi:hypothetical protein